MRAFSRDVDERTADMQLTLPVGALDVSDIRWQHRDEVRHAAAVLDTTEPEVIADWLYLPVWTVTRHLESLGLREPTQATRVKPMTSRDLDARKSKGDPPPGFEWGRGGKKIPTAATVLAIRRAVQGGLSNRQAARRWGISEASVHRYVLGKRGSAL